MHKQMRAETARAITTVMDTLFAPFSVPVVVLVLLLVSAPVGGNLVGGPTLETATQVEPPKLKTRPTQEGTCHGLKN